MKLNSKEYLSSQKLSQNLSWSKSCTFQSFGKYIGYFAVLLGYIIFVYILTNRFMFCCQFWGIKYTFSIRAAKHFAQDLIYRLS